MNAEQLVEKMADVEARIAVIYERFVTQFRAALYVSDLWDNMSREELHHADLLSRTANAAGTIAADPALEEHIRKLEAVVLQYEGEQEKIVHLQDALEATAHLEEAENEHLHAALSGLGAATRALAADPALQHRTRRLLDHAIQLYGTPALRERLAWHRFHD